METLEARLIAIVRASPTLMWVLTTLRTVGLPDWRLGSGAVYQSFWNAVTNRPPDYGIRDYDVAYFDPDSSWAAEDAVIRRVARAFAPPLRERVEVRNQARVHLWFPQKFNEPYAPLGRTDETFERFLCPAFSVGVRLEPDGAISIAAPFGLQDCFGLRLRPNPVRACNPDNRRKVMAAAKARWPELVLEGR